MGTPQSLIRAGVVLPLSALLVGPAFAQLTAQAVVPPGADPGRIERQVEPPRAPPSLGPAPVLPAPAAPAPARPEVRFRLNAVQLEGTTVLGEAELAPIYRPLLGTEISLVELNNLAGAIGERYRAAGYVLAQAIVPAREIRDGRVRILVLEGFVAQARIEGAKRGESAIRGYLDRLVADRPLTQAALERYLLLINDLPGVPARATLTPAAAATGASDLILAVTEKPQTAFATADNRGTKFAGRNQFGVGALFNSPFLSGDGLGFQVLTATPLRELRYMEATHETPIGDDGWKLQLRGLHSETHPSASLRPLDVEGENLLLSAGVSYPLLRSRAENLLLAARFAYRDSTTDVFDNSIRLSDDRLRTLALSASYDVVDDWQGINQIGLELTQGLDVLNATPTGSPLLSRAGGRPDFTPHSPDDTVL
ncbi:MAG: ShlB/FhaC/HecB family hemolysin secretion/activation protein [Alphaproteobacteria bacterium]|nr:ShlB/FhaC/HecB family hemolysin secretion/activation protein [Alphaproteobacteria bacterium]